MAYFLMVCQCSVTTDAHRRIKVYRHFVMRPLFPWTVWWWGWAQGYVVVATFCVEQGYCVAADMNRTGNWAHFHSGIRVIMGYTDYFQAFAGRAELHTRRPLIGLSCVFRRTLHFHRLVTFPEWFLHWTETRCNHRIVDGGYHRLLIGFYHVWR